MKEAAAPRKASDAHRLTRFLWWCSGSVADFVRDSPTERSKHAGLGGAVLSTWCLASFAGGYALYTMTAESAWGVPISIAGGLIWGLIIFNIDRFLVSSLRKSDTRSLRAVVASELLPASPRILFAVAIAFTIAEPLELRLFSSEIEDRVDANRDRLVADRQASLRRIAEPQVSTWRGEIVSIDEQLSGSQGRLDRLQREYVEESDGRGGSRRVGDGPLTEIKRAELARASSDHQALTASLTPRRAELQRRVDAAEQQLGEQLTAYRASLGSGYLARREALTELYNERAGVWGAVWGIFALMVMIEITPLLLKIFGSYGPYDARVALVEESEIREAQLQKDYRIAAATHHYELAQAAERAFEEASHDSGVAVRTSKVREAWKAFDGEVPVGGYRSVDHLLRHLREALSAHRSS